MGSFTVWGVFKLAFACGAGLALGGLAAALLINLFR